MKKEKKEASTDAEEEFDTATESKFKCWQDREKQKEIAAGREKLGLTPAASRRKNETGNPFPFTCNADDFGIAKEHRCDGSAPARPSPTSRQNRQRKSGTISRLAV